MENCNYHQTEGLTPEAGFYGLVKRMRAAQREYFANRCPSNLNRAKKLERQVDASIHEYEKAQGPAQAELF